MQKKVGDALYVLDLTPYTITEDTDVSIIYVQNEQIKGYKELNTELASKIHGFNQFIMTVLPRPWADGGDDPGPEPTGHTFTLSGSDVHSHVDVYFNDVLQEMTGSWTNVMPGTSIQIKPKEGYTKEWFGGIQNAEWVDSYNAWFPIYDGNYGMPDTDLTVTIEYIGQPQVEAYWGYTDLSNNPHRWEHQYFVKSPRVFITNESDSEWMNGTSQWLYPVDANGNAISINNSDGITVSSITSNNPLVTFDSSNGMPIVSRDSNNELPYGDVTITATIHDNSGAYADRTISYTLRLVNTFTLMIAHYYNPDTGEIDPSSVSSENDYIRGGGQLGLNINNMLRYSESKIIINGDLVPYEVDDNEFNAVGLPVGAEVSLWFDGMTSDIDTVYSVDSGEEISDRKEEHWIYLVMPEAPVNMQAHWNTNTINQIAFNDTVASHNGSNMDANGGRYYYINYYQTAPATYTNTIYYGAQGDRTAYGPSDFTFSVAQNSHGISVDLTDNGDGSYSFSMNSNNTPETFTINIIPS